MRYRCVSPCRLSCCAGFRIDDVDLKLAFRQLPQDGLLRRIEELPPDLKKRAIRIHRAVWVG